MHSSKQGGGNLGWMASMKLWVALQWYIFHCFSSHLIRNIEFYAQNIEDVEWDKYWNPKVYVENSLGDPKETIWQTLAFNKKAEAMVYEKRRIKGCFLENLELDEFPFDTQVTCQSFLLILSLFYL